MIIGEENFVTRPYDDYPFLILHKNFFISRVGEDLEIKANIYKKNNLFGDAEPYFLTSPVISFYVIDKNYNVVTRVTGSVTNVENFEITATLTPIDIDKSGKYFGFFEIFSLSTNPTTHVVTKTFLFSLPKQNDKQRINIIYS